MRYYKVIDNPTGIPMLWKDLPPEIKDDLPGEFLYNIKGVGSNGVIEEKTFVYLVEVDEEYVEMFDDLVVGEKEPDTIIVLDLDDFC